MTKQGESGQSNHTSGEFVNNSLAQALKVARHKLSSEPDKGAIDTTNSGLAAEIETEFVGSQRIETAHEPFKRGKTEAIPLVAEEKKKDHSPEAIESKKFVRDQVESMRGALKQLGKEGLLKQLIKAGFVEVDKHGDRIPGKREGSPEVLHAYEILVRKKNTEKGVVDREQKKKRTKEKNPKMPKQKKIAITDSRFTDLINKNPNQAREIIGEILGKW